MKLFLLIVSLFFAPQAGAQIWVEVDNSSKLLWQINSAAKVYFRNLNEFNAAQVACCYAYYLDSTTPRGKSIWSIILAKMATKKRITLGSLL